jgi:2-polyprenyl-6-methoxyphenol 4-hydroxylase
MSDHNMAAQSLETAIECDIAIVGGGMAGAGLALMLAKKMPQLSITLIEQQVLQAAEDVVLRVPSFDARSTALSCSSQQILESLALWSTLAEHAEPICAVHVSEKNRAAGLLMRAEEISLPALGHVIENRQLGNILLRAILQQAAIQTLSPANIHKISFTAQHAMLSGHAGSAFNVQAKLVVIADGAHSSLRQQLGIAVTSEPYGQHAVIANIELELAHSGIAYERFTDTGPIALLPLQDCEGRHRAALVWTVPEQDADTLLQLSDADFLARVQERFGQRCGQLTATGTRNSYALKLLWAQEQVRSRVVLLGSAAHHLHPVAGQGFNLILRDCQALVKTLMSANKNGHDIGDIAVLQHYIDEQRWDQQKTVSMSDWLPRLFSNREQPQMLVRAAALLGLDFLPGARARFARAATGL